MSDDLQLRLSELEMMVAHQEQTINELSDVVKRQWDEIDALKGEVARLDETKANTSADEDEGDRPPPHY